MLLHQGAAAFTLWTGRPAPLEVMKAALEKARAGGVRSAEGEPAGDDGTRPEAELAAAKAGGAGAAGDPGAAAGVGGSDSGSTAD
jgi:hypothetical protein